MTQPYALFLADILEDAGKPADIAEKAATELRRLHAENEALRKTLAASCDEERQQIWEAGPGGGCSRALNAESQRDALLEALKMMLEQFTKTPSTLKVSEARIKAHAAIKVAEGNA